jgi:hypothetical protein
VHDVDAGSPAFSPVDGDLPSASSRDTGAGGNHLPGVGAGVLQYGLRDALRGQLHRPASASLQGALDRLEQQRTRRTSTLLEDLNRPVQPIGEQLAEVLKRLYGSTPPGAAPGGHRRDT